MPSGSIIVIDYDGTNITSSVLPGSCRFGGQLNGIPDTFEFTVKDVNHSMGFVTGRQVGLTVDGVKLYGGYVFQVSRTYPFAAMNTANPDTTARYWKVRGVDYNVLFDKRVLRNPANYLTQIPNFSNSTMDGALIRQMWSDYIDTPAGFDTDTFVDDIAPPYELDTDTGAWLTQGSKARAQMEDFAAFNGPVWYFDADRNLHWHAIEDTVMRWGFSDQPNHNVITASPASYQGATIGPREIEATESGDHMVDDALIWGGSPLGSTSGVVFAREQDATQITDHGRWQLAELHFGELGYGIQAGVDERANVIVNGSPGAVGADQQRGLKYPQWQYKFAWFAHDVPLLSGVPDHIRPGYLATIELKVFGPSGSPLIQLLPLRNVTITIPSLDPTGKGYVRFDGLFGLQLDDPFTLWRFLLKQRRTGLSPVATTTGDSTSTTYGAYGEFEPTPAPDGSATVFTIPFGYIAGTTQVFRFPLGSPGGLLLRRNVDYTESDPAAGQVTIPGPLPSGDGLIIVCRTLG